MNEKKARMTHNMVCRSRYVSRLFKDPCYARCRTICYLMSKVRGCVVWQYIQPGQLLVPAASHLINAEVLV